MTNKSSPRTPEEMRTAIGTYSPEQWLRALVEAPAGDRDAWCEELLGIREVPKGTEVSLPDRIGYSPCSVASIVRAVFEVPLRESDVLLDVGSGLGKVCMLAALLSGARAVGVEVQKELVEIATARASELRMERVSFRAESAATAGLSAANVFFFYIPFTGELLHAVLAQIKEIAAKKPVIVCAVGFDLPPVPWLRARATSAFWSTIYDSEAPRVPRPLSADASALIAD